MDRIKNWFRKLGGKMQSFMYGRYGFDELSQVLYVIAMVLLITGMFINPSVFSGISLVLYIFALYRVFSKKYYRRRKELDAYLKFANPVKNWFRLNQRRWIDRKTHRYYRCAQCKTPLRVPKGKGKIKIRCPKCGAETVKKT